MIGKKLRLSRIINPETNRTCIVPMDHGVTLGPVRGLDNYLDTMISVANGGADAIIIHKGLFKVIANHPQLTQKCNFILHVSASTCLSADSDTKRLVASVEQAVKMGAVGVSVHVNLGSESEGKMLEDLGLISDACMEWGMPLLAMMYVRGNNLDSFDATYIAHAAKVAEEIGADIIKVNCPMHVEEIQKVVDCINTPLVVSGGDKMPMPEMLGKISGALKAGVTGVSIGRNVFQADDPEEATRIISGMVHNRLAYKEVDTNLSEEVAATQE